MNIFENPSWYLLSQIGKQNAISWTIWLNCVLLKLRSRVPFLQIKANVCFMISVERSSKYKLKIAESLPNHALISVAVIKGRGVR
jgi:hypothetical protein